MFRLKNGLKNSKGFALPTVMVASIIMLMVLVTVVSATSGISASLSTQYYDKLARDAAESGLDFARSCLESNHGVPLWSDSTPLTPSSDCTGNIQSGVTCPGDGVCTILKDTNIESVFSVGNATLDTYGRAVEINSTGTVNLLRTSNQSTWRSYNHSSYEKISYNGIAKDGLVLNLESKSITSYSGTGTSWTDLSGLGNNGTLMNGTTFGDGVMNFDGTDDKVTVSDSNSLDITDAITINAWVKWSSTAPSGREIVTKHDSANVSPGSYEFYQASQSVVFRTYNVTGVTTLASTSSVPNDTWAYITAVWDGTTKYIYINGVRETVTQSASGDLVTTSGKLSIGAYDNNSYPFAGSIGSVSIYNRALTDEEIKTNYKISKDVYSQKNVDVLVVAGGGGGGSSATSGGGGGGGGAGGLIYKEGYQLSNGQSINVTVGAGGAAGGAGANANGANGGNSVFGNLTAIGGGGGAKQGTAGLAGGSGGGAGFNNYATAFAGGAGTAGQGNTGGAVSVLTSAGAGGGGGAGSLGWANQLGHNSGNGGSGLSYSISGFPVTYSAGGKGGGYDNMSASASPANVGKGGNAAYSTGVAAAGGSGVVVVRYLTGSLTATGGTITKSGAYTIHTFTSSGTFVVGNKRASCSAILSAGESTGDGPYWIYPSGATNGLQIYCDMTNDGGGWTLVLQNNTAVATPSPTWANAINGNNIVGTYGHNLTAFDTLVGLGYWNNIGTKVRLQVGASPVAISHKATYDISLNSSNYYSLSLSNQNILLGETAPGFYVSHNNEKFSTYDADHDTYGTSCSALYNNHPWWYGSCWGGNFFAGGSGYQEAPYWTGSTTDYYTYGSIWLK